MTEVLTDLRAERRQRQVAQLLRAARGRCVVTGTPITFDNCVVIVDRDGRPRAVLSQAGWVKLGEPVHAYIGIQGWFADPDTIIEVSSNAGQEGRSS